MTEINSLDRQECQRALGQHGCADREDSLVEVETVAVVAPHLAAAAGSYAEERAGHALEVE